MHKSNLFNFINNIIASIKPMSQSKFIEILTNAYKSPARMKAGPPLLNAMGNCEGKEIDASFVI